MAELLSHKPSHLFLVTRQGLYGGRADEGEMDVYPLAPHGPHLTCLATDAKGVPLALGVRDGGVLLTRDGGRSWSQAPGTGGRDVTAIGCDERGVVAGQRGGGLLRVEPGGTTPFPALPGAGTWTAGALGGDGPAISALALVPGAWFAAASAGGVFLVPKGQDCRDVTGDLPRDVLTLAATGDRLWAGTPEGLSSTPLASPGDWQRSPLPPERRAVTFVAGDPTEPARLYCGAARSLAPARPGEPKGADAWLYASGDGGRTWVPAANPHLPVMRGLVTGIVVDRRVPGRVFASTSAGDVYESRDRLASFRLAAGSVPGVNQLVAGPLLA